MTTPTPDLTHLTAECERLKGESLREAEEMAIVMAYEAFRICLGIKTNRFKPQAVIKWMQLMLK